MSPRPDIANVLRLFRVYRERASLHGNTLTIPLAGLGIRLHLSPEQFYLLAEAPAARKPRLNVTDAGFVLALGKVGLVLERAQVLEINRAMVAIFGAAGRLLP